MHGNYQIIFLMSTLKLGESTSTLENEIQKYVQIRDFGLYRHFQVLEQKPFDLEIPVKSSVLYLNYYFKSLF